jgi:hypothetical protein
MGGIIPVPEEVEEKVRLTLKPAQVPATPKESSNGRVAH